MESIHSSLIVVHGGVWNDNVYEGGRKEYIPIPHSGISYKDLLSKLELRLKKDNSMYMFDLDALVKSPTGESMRMKITDDFELSCLMNLLELPIVHVCVCRRNIVYPPKLTLKKSRRSCVQKQICDDDVCNRDNTTYELVSDDGHFYDRNLNMEDEVYDSNDSFGDEQHNYAAEDRDIVPPLVVENETGEENSQHDTTWVVPGAAYHASQPCQDLVVANQFASGELILGGYFPDKEHMSEALGLYHMKNHLVFVTNKSNKERYYVRCKYPERCEFIMRARSFGRAWRIYEWALHTCQSDLRYNPHPKIASKVVASYFSPNLLEAGVTLRPRDIQGQLLREHGVHVKYHTALAGRNHALNLTYGDADQSFKVLPKYLYMLERSNPGSIVDLQQLEDGSFQYCYFSLAACIRAFRACRPVIVIDATHLKGKYKGVMFIAATKDGNEQVVPLAFGIGDKENDSSWTWFLRLIRRTFGCPDELLIVSDQHLSIKNAVDSVYPRAYHGLCSFHIQGNLKSWGDTVIKLFQGAATCYKSRDFELYMENLKATAPRAHDKLIGMDPRRWARSKCPVRRYEYGTSNGVEVLNSRLRWARKLPICPLLESVRTMLQDWFYERRTRAGARTLELTVYAHTRLADAIETGRSMRVEPINHTNFKVISGIKSNIVDIAARKCTCLVFDSDLIPCSHASAAISYVRQSPLSYVHSYYTTETWREIYAGDVMPVPDKDEWRVPPDVESMVIGTPINPRQAGRPRTKRIPSGSSSSQNRICSRCHQKGHYQSTCKAVLPTIPEEVSSNQPSAKRPRNKKKCGICGIVGHTRLKCLDPHRF